MVDNQKIDILAYMSPILSDPNENSKKAYEALDAGNNKEFFKQRSIWDFKLEVIAWSLVVIFLAAIVIWQFFFK